MTLIGTDYRPASLEPDDHRAPNPYAGFSTGPGGRRRGRAPRMSTSEARRRREVLTGDAPPSPWGALPEQPRATAATPVPAPPPATPRRPSTDRRGATSPRPRRRATTALLGLGVAAALLLAGLGVSRLVATTSEPADVDIAWSIEPDDIAPDAYAELGSVDGTATGGVLTTTEGWVVRLDGEDGYGGVPQPDLLAGLDPATGSVQWLRDLPDGHCTQTVPGEDLVCLARLGGDGAPLEILALDPATGDPTSDAVPTQLTEPPAMIAPLGDGLVVLDADRRFTALAPDGSARWQQPLVAPDWDPEHQLPDVAIYPGAVVVRMPIYDETVHMTEDGRRQQLGCRNLVVTAPAWICEEDLDWTVGRAPDGSELWRTDWHDLHLVSTYQRAIPVAIAEGVTSSAPGAAGVSTVALVDAATGAVGPASRLDGGGNLSFLGETAHPVVTTDSSVALLDAAGSGLEWETPVEDEYLSIATGGVAGGVLVVDGEHLHGIDLATGELLWERTATAADVWVLDGVVLGMSAYELERYALP